MLLMASWRRLAVVGNSQDDSLPKMIMISTATIGSDLMMVNGNHHQNRPTKSLSSPMRMTILPLKLIKAKLHPTFKMIAGPTGS